MSARARSPGAVKLRGEIERRQKAVDYQLAQQEEERRKAQDDRNRRLADYDKMIAEGQAEMQKRNILTPKYMEEVQQSRVRVVEGLDKMLREANESIDRKISELRARRQQLQTEIDETLQ
jgi:hypothetical protein